MELHASDTAVISNEEIVEIAFGIVLDRIRRRAPREALRLSNTKQLNVSRSITSRCVRTYTYECNESSSPSYNENLDAETVANDCKATEKSDKTTAITVEQREVATSVSPLPAHSCDSTWGCYYMRSDTKSRDTVMACHNSGASSTAATAATRSRERQRRAWQLDPWSCGPTDGCSAPELANDSCNFQVKIDQQELRRAFGKEAAANFPSELLVDVTCSGSCRVSQVSLKQCEEQQCVLSMRVDAPPSLSLEEPPRLLATSGSSDFARDLTDCGCTGTGLTSHWPRANLGKLCQRPVRRRYIST